jgi:hypothetical protein
LRYSFWVKADKRIRVRVKVRVRVRDRVSTRWRDKNIQYCNLVGDYLKSSKDLGTKLSQALTLTLTQ